MQNDIGYLKVLYKNENVKIAPFIWDSFILDQHLKQAGYKDAADFKEQTRRTSANAIHIYEPNNTITKTCLIPLTIATHHRRNSKVKLDKCRTFCTDKIRKSGYFREWCRSREIYIGGPENDQYFEFYGRLSLILSLIMLCPNAITLSHQHSCELNYLYFDIIYLGLPLVHNSPALSSCGYYYANTDIDGASRQVDMAALTHIANSAEYDKNANALIADYSLDKPENLFFYIRSIANLAKA